MRATYLVAGLFKDGRMDPQMFPAEKAYEMATLGGARRCGMQDQIGSLEVGKRADVVLHDTDRPEWRPLLNVINQLVWSADGRGVHTVVVDGRVVVEDGHMTTIDESALWPRPSGEASDRRHAPACPTRPSSRSGEAAELTWWEGLLLVLGGLAAGVINTMAGGGSALTVPLLVLAGVPGNQANGSNRVGILAASAAAVLSFRRSKATSLAGSGKVLLPAVIGSVVGSYTISQVADDTFETVFGLSDGPDRDPHRRETEAQARRGAVAGVGHVRGVPRDRAVRRGVPGRRRSRPPRGPHHAPATTS